MSFKNTLICEEFRSEVWRYIDGTFSEEERSFWESHLSSCLSCKMLLDETEKGLSLYENLELEDLSDENFDLMLKKATGAKRFLQYFSQVFNIKTRIWKTNSIKLNPAFNKIALSTAAFAIVLAVMLIIYPLKPKINIYFKEETTKEPLNTLDDSDVSGKGNNTPAEIPLREENKITDTEKAIGNEEEYTEAKHSTGIKHETMDWGGEKVKKSIDGVSNSLSIIDAKDNWKDHGMDQWAMKTKAISVEIQRLEKELNNSSL
ncbi:MAG: zf-HC2 domain-containing protein [Bacteroidota bacterium]|nr:zf-HC2 domain-containing protein [Bacteroidota bacterium]MDP4191408.1 zf-HC2 domain-containing protein [Bacteroidota bacterium]MDP4193631.1 zf-HC2 domain-containing protein [Bacteroidota bacterium]